VIGRLNYLERSTRPDVSYATHQLARFSANPKYEHGKAVKWLGRYLRSTREDGIIMTPDKRGFECHVDADFAGNWNKETAMNDIDTARSRSGYVITYVNCPIVWASKMQTEIAMSTTEAEYVAMSISLRECIPLMQLMHELKRLKYPIVHTPPKVFIKVFEENMGALQMARLPKMRMRTKHINVKYHHFRQHVARGDITIHYVQSNHQRADIFTKPVAEDDFVRHRKSIMGW
jgi:hypothetical protein